MILLSWAWHKCFSFRQNIFTKIHWEVEKRGISFPEFYICSSKFLPRITSLQSAKHPVMFWIVSVVSLRISLFEFYFFHLHLSIQNYTLMGIKKFFFLFLQNFKDVVPLPFDVHHFWQEVCDNSYHYCLEPTVFGTVFWNQPLCWVTFNIFLCHGY